VLFVIGSKLPADTREYLPSKVIRRVLAVLKIVNAELMTAITAGHVVAAFIFVDSDAAFWALNSAILFLPFLEV